MRTPPLAALVVLLELLGTACSDQARPAPTPIEAEAPAVHRPRREADQPETHATSPEVQAPAGPVGPQVPPAEIEALLDEAARLEVEGRDTLATVRLRKCANRDPGSARCDGRLGVALSRSPQHRAEALYLLERAIALNEAAAPADLYEAVGEALRRHTRYAAAADAIRLAIDREETGARHAALARALVSLPDGRDAAIAALERAWALDQDHPEWLREQAALEAQRPGGAPAAIALLERYLEHTGGASQARDRAVEARIDELRRLASPPDPGRAGAPRRRAATGEGATP